MIGIDHSLDSAMLRDRVRLAMAVGEVLWHLCVAGFLFRICFNTAGFTGEKHAQAIGFIALEFLTIGSVSLFAREKWGKIIRVVLLFILGGAVMALWTHAGYAWGVIISYFCINSFVKIEQIMRYIRYETGKKKPLMMTSILTFVLTIFIGMLVIVPVFRILVVDVMKSPRPGLYLEGGGNMLIVVLAGTYFLVSAGFSMISVFVERKALRSKIKVTENMDFFEMQEQAKRKTGVLVAYFLGTILFIIFSMYFVVVFTLWDSEGIMGFSRLWNPGLFLGITGLTTIGISTASVIKMKRLSKGGVALASLLGARALHPDTIDVAERRLLNVVEEMSIASGTPVPLVFVLDGERSINALTAGFSPADAAIIVTAPCMRLLNRDELQGLVAHEFSHILNGDIKLNLRLIGMLHGLMAIGIFGFCLMAGSFNPKGLATSAKEGRARPIFFVLGIPVLILGYGGVLAGKLIKSAISRQREYLADAAAIQFTRFPEGIAGALKKIGGFMHGSRIRNPHAQEASHMFFANPLSRYQIFATHPPLKDRVRRIDPSFDGRFAKHYKI